MSEQIDNGKGFLKDKLGGFQADPPEHVWDSISARLGGRSRRGMIIIALSAAATIALAVTLGIKLFGPELTTQSGLADSQPVPAESSTSSNTNPIETSPVENSPVETSPVESRSSLEEKVRSVVQEVSTASASAENETENSSLAILETDDSETLTISPNVDDQEVVEFQDLSEVQYAAEDQVVADAEERANPGLDEEDLLDEEDSSVEEDPSGEELEDEIILEPYPEIEEIEERDPRWIVGAALSPLYSFRDAESSVMSGTSHESGMVSYAGGVHVSYRTTSRLAIESGVFYNKMGIDIGSPGIQLSSRTFEFSPVGAEAASSNIVAISNSVGNIVSKSGDVYVNNYKINAEYTDNSFEDQLLLADIPSDEGIRQHLDYLELPFNLRYTIIDRDIEVQLVGGMSTNLLVSNYVTTVTTDGRSNIGYLTNIRNVNYSGNAGIGMVYHIQEQFSLHFEPRFRYFLNSVNDVSLPSTRPYAFGIFTGLSYRF